MQNLLALSCRVGDEAEIIDRRMTADRLLLATEKNKQVQ
jgi:hypothetical protein